LDIGYFYLRFTQSGQWARTRLKGGIFEHKMGLGFISYTIVQAQFKKGEKIIEALQSSWR